MSSVQSLQTTSRFKPVFQLVKNDKINQGLKKNKNNNIQTITGGGVDTLGAGDTFNAAVIGCVSSGLDLAKSVQLACQVLPFDCL